MSFGFSIGDFLAVGNLAWTVYRSCKGLTEEFQEVSREALSVHTVIKELQDEAGDGQSILNSRGVPRKRELMLLVKNLEEALRSLDAIITKYQGLARREKRIWNQLRLATEDLDKIRGKLTFHVSAINAFTASLSRGTLAQIEASVLEIMREVRQGRRPPSIASIDETKNDSVWKELESELAEDGISKIDVAKHKTAIRVFVQGLLSDPGAETMSLDEVASLVESNNDHGASWNLSSRGPSRVPTMSSVDKVSLVSADSEQTYVSAMEELSGEGNLASADTEPRVSFAAFTRFPKASDPDSEGVEGIDKRLKQLTYGSKTTDRSIYRYRHSIDASVLGPNPTGSSPKDGLETVNAQMILMIDPYHSSVSKLAHAYMQSLIKTSNVVREHVDTVRSTGWRMLERGGMDTVLIDTLIRELLTSKRIEVPKKWSSYFSKFGQFRFQDIYEFDHIINFDSTSFRQYLEDNIENIAAVKARVGMENKNLARLTKYDLPTSLQTPESMSERMYSFMPEMFRNRQKLALDEIFRAVQRFTLDFLEREYGLKKTSQGFEKQASRRPSRSSSLPPLERNTKSGSSG